MKSSIQSKNILDVLISFWRLCSTLALLFIFLGLLKSSNFGLVSLDIYAPLCIYPIPHGIKQCEPLLHLSINPIIANAFHCSHTCIFRRCIIYNLHLSLTVPYRLFLLHDKVSIKNDTKLYAANPFLIEQEKKTARPESKIEMSVITHSDTLSGEDQRREFLHFHALKPAMPFSSQYNSRTLGHFSFSRSSLYIFLELLIIFE